MTTLTVHILFLSKISEYTKLKLCETAFHEFVPVITYGRDLAFHEVSLKLKCAANEQNPNGGISTRTIVGMQG